MSSYYFIGQTAPTVNPGPTTASTFNATSPANAYQIGGNTVLESDGASVYLSPQNDTTGSVFLFTGGAQRVGVSSTGIVSFAAAGQVGWTGRAQLTSPANGVLQVQDAAGGGTLAVTRVVLGANAATGGAAIVLNNTVNRIGIMRGDASAYTEIITSGYLYSSSGGLTDVSGNNGISWSGGVCTIGVGGGTPIVGALIAASGMWSNVKELSTSVTTSRAITAAESGTHFNNTGAAGAVTLTLPTATRGLKYDFVCSAAQNFIVTAPSAGLLKSNGGVSNQTATITSANQYSSFSLFCYDGTNWCFEATYGTIALS